MCVRACAHSDSEMEIEAEHYSNGVSENSTTRIMNGTYKHQEVMQGDDNSMGNGVAGTHTLLFLQLVTTDKRVYNAGLPESCVEKVQRIGISTTFHSLVYTLTLLCKLCIDTY